MIELRKKMQNKNFESEEMLSKNHRVKFKNKLDSQLHKRLKFNKTLFKIAASVLILLGVVYFIKDSLTNQNTIVNKSGLSINELSPELGKIESYYTTAINYELANLPITEKNKKIINSYLDKIGLLSQQYELLNKQLLKDDFDENLINKLIDNMQIRLQLLLELKSQLNKTKNPKNENKLL